MADDTHDEQQDDIEHEPDDAEAADGRPDGETGASADEGHAAAGDDTAETIQSRDDQSDDPRSVPSDDEDDPAEDSAHHSPGRMGSLSDRAASPGRRIANQVNASIIGTLYVWYAGHAGEVAIPMDSDAGLRCIAGWHQNRSLRWQDDLDPVTSDGHAAWAALELQGVLAMLWMPGLPSARQPQRMAMDPVAT